MSNNDNLPDFGRPGGKIIKSFSLSQEALDIVAEIAAGRGETNLSHVVDTMLVFYGRRALAQLKAREAQA